MKKVLVLGVSGTFGKHVAQAMQAEGWQIKAMLRDESRLPEQFSGIETVEGDASVYNDVERAVKGVTAVVYGISPANYDWEDKALPWLEVTARVAAREKLTVIFPGNIYSYDPQQSALLDEDTEHSPICSKGEIRQAMELCLQQAASAGVKVLILRMGDFIAPKPLQGALPNMLSDKGNKVVLQSLGDKDLSHAWAYVPDAAKTVALLMNKIDTLPAFNVFHFKGYSHSVSEMAREIEIKTGKQVVIKDFPWWFLNMLRPFMVAIRGLFEMRYLWNYELLMDEHKLRKVLGEVPHTPIAQALVDSGYITSK